MKYFIIFSFFLLGIYNSVAQNSKTHKADSLNLFISFNEIQRPWIIEQGGFGIDVALLNKSKDTIYFIDNNNTLLGNYVTNNYNFDISHGDYVGGIIPVKKSIPPDSSIREFIMIRWLNTNTKNIRIGFNFIKTSKYENIKTKSKLLYKNTNVIWSNTIQLIK